MDELFAMDYDNLLDLALDKDVGPALSLDIPRGPPRPPQPKVHPPSGPGRDRTRERSGSATKRKQSSWSPRSQNLAEEMQRKSRRPARKSKTRGRLKIREQSSILRKKEEHEFGEDEEDDEDDYTPSRSRRRGASGMVRGSYLCRYCGKPKKGHVCTYRAPTGRNKKKVKTRNAFAQAEIDPTLTVAVMKEDILLEREMARLGITNYIPRDEHALQLLCGELGVELDSPNTFAAKRGWVHAAAASANKHRSPRPAMTMDVSSSSSSSSDGAGQGGSKKRTRQLRSPSTSPNTSAARGQPRFMRSPDAKHQRVVSPPVYSLQSSTKKTGPRVFVNWPDPPSAGAASRAAGGGQVQPASSLRTGGALSSEQRTSMPLHRRRSVHRSSSPLRGVTHRAAALPYGAVRRPGTLQRAGLVEPAPTRVAVASAQAAGGGGTGGNMRHRGSLIWTESPGAAAAAAATAAAAAPQRRHSSVDWTVPMRHQLSRAESAEMDELRMSYRRWRGSAGPDRRLGRVRSGSLTSSLGTLSPSRMSPEVLRASRASANVHLNREGRRSRRAYSESAALEVEVPRTTAQFSRAEAVPVPMSISPLPQPAMAVAMDPAASGQQRRGRRMSFPSLPMTTSSATPIPVATATPMKMKLDLPVASSSNQPFLAATKSSPGVEGMQVAIAMSVPVPPPPPSRPSRAAKMAAQAQAQAQDSNSKNKVQGSRRPRPPPFTFERYDTF